MKAIKYLCKECANQLKVRVSGAISNWVGHFKCDNCETRDRFEMFNISDEESKRIREENK